MPILNVDIANTCSAEQKKRLIHDLTKTTHDLLNIPAEKILVILNEHEKNAWGRAGVSSEDLDFENLSRRKDMD